MSRHKTTLTLWLLTDIALFVGLYATAYYLRVGQWESTDFPFDRFIVATQITAPVWLLVLATTRTFAMTRNQKTLRNGSYIAYSCLVGVALYTLVYYFQFTEFFSRKLLIYAFVLSTAGVWLWHIVFSQIQRRILRSNPPVFPTLIVGVTRESKQLIENLNRNRNPLTPVAILDGRGSKEMEIDGVPVLGKLNKLEEVLEEKGVTHLIQCSDLEQSLNLLSACRNRKITYLLLPSVLGIVEKDERVESLEGQPVTVVPPKESLLSWFVR